MPYFFDVTLEGETRAYPNGPFASQQEADDSRTARLADRPNDTHGAVYEADANHPETFPRVIMVVSKDGVDCNVWSDGVEEPV
jgi:hypothetical protein